MANSILTLFPTADLLLAATPIELERALLRFTMEVSDDPMRRMIVRDSIATELFGIGVGCYAYDASKRNAVDRAISRVWKILEVAGLIEEPDPGNGKNGTGLKPRGSAIAGYPCDIATDNG